MTNGEWPVYVSYSWQTEAQKPMVEKLQQDAREFPRIRLVRDTEECQPGASIAAFLKEVGKAPRLILVLSEPYFQSKYTLKEFAIALDHGGLNTRVKVVLVGDFRLDRYLDDHRAELQQRLVDHGIHLPLENYAPQLHELTDSLVSISGADKETEFGPVLQGILDSYQQFPNPEVGDEERLVALRNAELPYFQEQVAAFFGRSSSLKPLQENLRRRAAAPGIEMVASAPALVCNIGIGDTQQKVLQKVLIPAIDSTLQAARQEAKITTALLDGLLEIVGWSAATLVNDMWIQAHGVSLCDLGSPGVIDIALGRAHLIELVVARANRRPAKIVKQGQRIIASGSGVVLDGPESAQETLTFIFRKLCERFMPDEEIEAGLSEVQPGYWEELDARISIRRETENIFIAFRMPDGWGGNLRAALSRHLRCLPQIWVTPPDATGPVLLLSEARVWALLGELVAKIEGYRGYVGKD